MSFHVVNDFVLTPLHWELTAIFQHRLSDLSFSPLQLFIPKIIVKLFPELS